MKRLCSAVGAIALATPLAAAQVTAVGPFQGAFGEDFESQPAQANVSCVAGRLFRSQADVCGPSSISLTAAVVPAFTPVVPGPRSGAQMFHTEWGVVVTFDRPIRRFGGYFGGFSGDAIFVDTSGGVAGRERFVTSCTQTGCTWVWNGWDVQSNTPVQQVTLFGLGATGGFFQLDDLELDFTCDSTSTSYCTAGTSALGCQALLSATGTASATASSGFVLSATGLEGQREGLFFYGSNGRQSQPWGNGTSFQCVAPPVKRGGLLPRTGVVGFCGGTFSQDLNARWCPTCPKPQHNPGAGAVVQAQLWYRDPLNTSNQTTGMSDAVEFTMCP